LALQRRDRMTVGIGIVGTGRHGSRYVEHIRNDVEDSDLVAVCRRDQGKLQEFGRRFGVKNLYTDYRDLVADPAVDAVAVVTPNNLHMPITLAAAEKGKHVLVEKPMALNVQEARSMVSAARRYGIKLMVSHNFRYHPMVRGVKALLQKAGRPYQVSMCKRQQPAHGWREDRARSGGGAVMDLGVHIFDQARFLLGKEPRGVICSTAKVLSSEVEDSFASIIDFDDCLVSCDASMCSGSRVDLIEVATDGKQILGDRYGRTIVEIEGLERRTRRIEGSEYTLGKVLRDFVASIVNDTQPPISGEDGLRAVEMAQACYESARTGGRVEL